MPPKASGSAETSNWVPSGENCAFRNIVQKSARVSESQRTALTGLQVIEMQELVRQRIVQTVVGHVEMFEIFVFVTLGVV